MKIGTKSVLFGAHQFILHPLFVAAAWWKLYGFPWDPRLWVAFIVHDLGYWGKPDMDGPEGERHVEWGARVMGRLFDCNDGSGGCSFSCGKLINSCCRMNFWHDLCLYHSRFRAKQDRRLCSPLCFADKLSICLEPAWLYLPRVILSGEIREYMKLAVDKYSTMGLRTTSRNSWFADVQTYLRRWVAEHKDGRPDSWTPAAGKQAAAERRGGKMGIAVKMPLFQPDAQGNNTAESVSHLPPAALPQMMVCKVCRDEHNEDSNHSRPHLVDNFCASHGCVPVTEPKPRMMIQNKRVHLEDGNCKSFGCVPVEEKHE